MADHDLIAEMKRAFNKRSEAAYLSAKEASEQGKLKLVDEFVMQPYEGHGFARPENNLSFFAIAEAFLAECLGGRYEPVGSDFENSSVSIPTGAEEIPGLSDALVAQ